MFKKEGLLETLPRRLLHRHSYTKIEFRQVTGEHSHWSEREYRCESCGKTRWVDGRFDPYE